MTTSGCFGCQPSPSPVLTRAPLTEWKLSKVQSKCEIYTKNLCFQDTIRNAYFSQCFLNCCYISRHPHNAIIDPTLPLKNKTDMLTSLLSMEAFKAATSFKWETAMNPETIKSSVMYTSHERHGASKHRVLHCLYNKFQASKKENFKIHHVWPFIWRILR